MQDQETDILSARESRIAVALFEIMKPQIEKMIDDKLKSWAWSDTEFEISDHESAINDMINDYIRYNITITSTID